MNKIIYKNISSDINKVNLNNNKYIINSVLPYLANIGCIGVDKTYKNKHLYYYNSNTKDAIDRFICKLDESLNIEYEGLDVYSIENYCKCFLTDEEVKKIWLWLTGNLNDLTGGS